MNAMKTPPAFSRNHQGFWEYKAIGPAQDPRNRVEIAIIFNKPAITRCILVILALSVITFILSVPTSVKPRYSIFPAEFLLSQ